MEHKLIEAIYNVTIDPESYYELLSIWEQEFLDNPTAINAEKIVENHCDRAFAILEMVGSVSRSSSLQQNIENYPLPTFILSSKKQIIFANDMAKNLFGVKNADNLTDIGLTDEQLLRINDFHNKLDYADKEIFFASTAGIDEHNEQTAILLALSKIFDEDTKTNLLQISVISTIWNDNIGDKIKSIFEFSNAELDLAKRLISGASLNDIATSKNRAIETIRTQMKSVFRKTKTNTQSETIKLIVALLNFNLQNDSYLSDDLNTGQHFNMLMKQNNQIIREGGRKLYYEIYGDPNGQPILFLHGLITGTKLPKSAVQFLNKNKLKIIAPHRAAFGYSDPISKKNDEHFLSDMIAVMNEENIDKFKIFAQHSGSYYGFVLANALPDRVQKLRIVNGDLPIASFKQIHSMDKVQKIFAYTARYTPQLLPFLIKGSAAQIKKRGIESLVDEVFKSSKADAKYTHNSEIKSIILNGFKASFSNGSDFVVSDVTLLCGQNWQDLMSVTSCPVELFHSTETPVFPIEQVRDFVKRHQNLRLTEIENGGQFIFYEYPARFLDDF